MTELRKLGVYCNTEATTVYAWSTSTALSECPNNAGHSIDTNSGFIDTESTDSVRYHILSSASATVGDIISIDDSGNAVVGYSYPTKTMFEDKSAASITCCKMSNTQYVVAYTSTMSYPTANNGYAVLCTLSGSTLTYGTPVCFSGTSNTALTSITVTALSATDLTIAYRGSATGNIVFGAISGSGAGGTISFGSVTAFNATAPGNQPGTIIVLKMSSTQIVIVYRDTSNSGRGTWILGTLSGVGAAITAIWNTKSLFQSNTTANNQYAISADVIDSTRFIVCYDNNNASFAAVIGTISGTGLLASITQGVTLDNIDSTSAKAGRDCNVLVIDTNTALLFYRRSNDNNTRGKCVLVTTSNSGVAAAAQSITAGTPIYYTSSPGIQSPIAVKVSSTRAIVSYVNAGNNNSGELAIIDIVSGAPVATATGILHAQSIIYNTLCISSTTGIIVFFRDAFYLNTGVGTYGAIGASDIDFGETFGRTLTGFAMDSDTTGNVIRVYAGKKVDFLTGLEVGEPYYAHGDGTISTSSAQINNADAPVLLGTAIGDGQLLRS